MSVENVSGFEMIMKVVWKFSKCGKVSPDMEMVAILDLSLTFKATSIRNEN